MDWTYLHVAQPSLGDICVCIYIHTSYISLSHQENMSIGLLWCLCACTVFSVSGVLLLSLVLERRALSYSTTRHTCIDNIASTCTLIAADGMSSRQHAPMGKLESVRMFRHGTGRRSIAACQPRSFRTPPDIPLPVSPAFEVPIATVRKFGPAFKGHARPDPSPHCCSPLVSPRFYSAFC